MTSHMKIFLAIFVLPFAISASIEFMPLWLSVPTSFICGVFWFGAVVAVRYLPKKDKNANTGN